MNLVWLRRDLRVQDHPAIKRALDEGCTKVVFIDSEQQWLKHNESPLSIELRRRRVNHLTSELSDYGLNLSVIRVDWFADIPEALYQFCNEHYIQRVYFQLETPVDETQRDEEVTELLEKNQIQVNRLPYDLIVSQPVLNQQGQPFRVFTPYYKKWIHMLDSPKLWNRYLLSNPGGSQSQSLPYSDKTEYDSLLPHQTHITEEIQNQLDAFCEMKLSNYQDSRDFPSIQGTSKLSACLSLGMLGPRQLLTAIKNAHDRHQTDWKTDFWLRELAWRDFYRQLMIHFPHLSRDQNFNQSICNSLWKQDPQNVLAWKHGMTGFPIIDAAMRQLKQTGWMHNRLRMLSASFLTKLLFVDWRVGEKHFMQNLIDGEYSANNGGWQWSASTGCDAAPYFRIFNPTAQSIKFDKDGDFIRKFVPELEKLSAKSIHDPSPMERQSCNYPLAIINYKEARNFALDAFKRT